MRIIYILLVSFSAIFANVAIVSAFHGKAIVIRDGKTIDVKIGFKLEKTDKLVTKNNTKLQLLFKDKTIITVGKNAKFSILEYTYDEKDTKNVKAKFNFTKGFFRTVTGKIGKINPKRFNIKVKTASIGIRGTRFDVFVSPTALKVSLFQGALFLLQNKQITPLLPGQMLIYKFGDKVDVQDGVLKEGVELSKKSVVSEDKIKDEVIKVENTFDEKTVTQGIVENIIDNNVKDEVKNIIDNNINDSKDNVKDHESTDIFDIEKLTQVELNEYLTSDIVNSLADYTTPTSVIDGYINKNQTAEYNGNISGTYTNGIDTTTETGDIKLVIDFGNSSMTADINNMTGDANVFNSNNYNRMESFTNEGFIVKHADQEGTITGKFYGSSGDVVAGTLNLEESTESFNGTFIGKK